MKKKQARAGHTFQVFVDEHSPEEVIEVDRIWKKKLQNQKNRRYTIIMLSAVCIMILIFGLLIGLLHSPSPKVHYQLEEIIYMNTKYAYLQSNIPHLKFLIPPEDTKQIRILKGIGILYPQIIAWIDSNVAAHHKVLFIPNEVFRVNVLGIALGYYLKQSAGGLLTIGIEGIKFKEMTEKNIELINKDLKDPMPIELITLKDLKLGQYDLIVLQNNGFHRQLNNTNNSRIIIIRRQNVETTIMDTIFPAHNKIEILKGQTNEQIRALPSQYGYALFPYSPSDNTEDNYILLVPESVNDLELCEQVNSELKQRPSVRNLVQRLKNQTFTNTSLLYAINSLAGLQIISTLPLSKIYSINSSFTSSSVIPIKDINEFERSSRNIFILSSQAVQTFSLGQNDELFVQIIGEAERQKITSKFNDFLVSVVSPFNNKGCFYPPALIDRTNSSRYFLFIRSKQSSPPPEM